MKPKVGEVWKFVPARSSQYSIFPAFGDGARPSIACLQSCEEFMILEAKENCFYSADGYPCSTMWAKIISTEVDKMGWIIFRHPDGTTYMEKVCD